MILKLYMVSILHLNVYFYISNGGIFLKLHFKHFLSLKVFRFSWIFFLPVENGDGVAVFDPERQLSCKAHLTMAAEAASSSAQPQPSSRSDPGA